MSIGLDLGSYQFRSVRSEGGRLIARRCPAVFTTISDTAAHRRLLQQSETQFVTCSDQLLVFGESAREWSAMLNLPTTPLLVGGRISGADSVSRQVLTLMVDAVLPAPEKPNTICKLTLPGGSSDDLSDVRDADFFQQLVALRGYRPQIVTSTLALALAELNHDSFTGITVTLGHTTSEFGVIHCGRELLRCVVMSGLETFEQATQLGRHALPMEPLSVAANVERDYTRFFASVIDEARTRFELDGTLKTLPRMMPVVCAGGITSEKSFLPLFQRAWDESNWPTSTRPVRVASDSDFAVVRGCLIQAELESPSEAQAA